MSLFPRILSAVLLTAFATLGSAQGVQPKGRIVSPTPSAESPFEYGGAADLAVQVRSAAEMAPQDRGLAESEFSSIARTPGIEQMRFPGPGWTYEQIECPLFPDQLILRFTRARAADEVSIFTATIQRDARHRVSAVPILRRSFALFSQAPVSRLAVSTFNRLLAEEHPSDKPQGVQVALCYAALAGADPVAGGQDSQRAGKFEVIAAEVPIVELKGDGKSTIRFSTPGAHPSRWELEFNRRGRLLSASRFALKTKDIRLVSSRDELRSRPVPLAKAERRRPVPAAKLPQQ